MEREVRTTPSITVGDLIKVQKARLKIELFAGKTSLHRKISLSDVNRPGLALAGHLEHFRAERIQIIGRGEQAYASKADQKRLFESLS